MSFNYQEALDYLAFKTKQEEILAQCSDGTTNLIWVYADEARK